MNNILFDAMGRKFIFAILVTILGFILVLTGYVKAVDWQNFVMVMGGIYVLGNLGDRITKK